MLPKQRALFYHELNQANIASTRVIGTLLIFFGILILGIDAYRFYSRIFFQQYYYYGLLASHLLMIGIGITTLYIHYFHIDKIKNGSRVTIDIFIYSFILLFGLAVIPLTWFDLLTRGSVIPFALYLVVVNLLFQLPTKWRLGINILSYLVLIIGLIFFIEGRYDQYVVFLEALGIIFVTLIIANIQFKLRKEKFQTQIELMDKNKAIAEDNSALMMKALQSQMNPHFIFNTLNSIQHFLVFNDQQSSIRYLNRFARLMRQIFEFSNKDLISLDKEIEFLKIYLELEILRFESKVVVDFEIDPDFLHIGTEYYLPPLVLQPAVENAFKHGLMHLEEQGMLYIKFSITEDHILVCEITDNGVGRDFILEEQKDVEQESGGISIIEERLAVFETLLKDDRKTHFSIEDLGQEQSGISGTKVIIHLPLVSAALAKTNFNS